MTPSRRPAPRPGSRASVDILVVAKAPIPGRVKTRLCPPCTPATAAALAEAALRDTLAVAREVAGETGADVVLALDGPPGSWLPPGVRVVPQGGGTLNDRLAAAWSHMSGPAVQVGMDTPQVTAARLDAACRTLLRADVDAVLGPADDGGWWLVGLACGPTVLAAPAPPVGRLFAGVPMSSPDTGARQHDRLRDLGLRVALLESCNDVDTIEDARAVAAAAPGTHFAAAFRRLAV